MYILLDFFASAWGVIRSLLLFIDSIGLTFIDNAYNLLIKAMNAFDGTVVKEIATNIAHNVYVIIGIFALFRIAVILVNTIINPDKLTDKESGFGNVLSRFVITICLFVVVPFIFDASRTLQSKIMDNNYISKVIIGTNLTDDTEGPGKVMKDLAVRALIHPDDRYEKIATKNDDNTYSSSGECSAAVESWNNDAGIETLTRFIGDYDEVDGENIYCYSYAPFVTLLVGGFMTYVLLSFAIDIAVRSVELLALEILAPLFIVTFIDPKSGSNGAFKKWTKTCMNTFVSLFIKVGIVCLMLLFMTNLKRLMSANDNNSMFLNLLMMIAILIFAKKAPKWIGDMLGVEGGLGELGIGKKLAGAALVGGALSKGGRAALGLGAGAIKNVHAARKANRINRSSEGQTIRSRAHNAAALETGLKNKANAYLGSMFSKQGAKENWNNMMQGKKANIIGGASAMLNGTISGLKAGWTSNDLKDMNSKTSSNAKNLRDTYAPGYKSRIGKFGEFLSDKSDRGMDIALGDSFARSDRAKTVKDDNDALANGMLVRKADGSRDKKQSPVNLGEVKDLCKDYNLDPTNIEGISNALIRARINAGTLKDVSLDANGITFNGGIKASDMAKEKGVFNNVGSMSMESIAREAAIEKVTAAKNNEDRISQANQVIAAANSQILELKGNIETTFGSDAKKAFSSLESRFDEMANAQAKIVKLQREIYENPTDSAKKAELLAAQQDFEAAKTTAESIKNVGLAGLIGQGSADGIFASLSERFNNVTVVSKLNEQNDSIKKSIANDINLYGADSYYVPETKDKSEKVNYSTNPERVGEIIELMNFAKSKVDKRLEAAKEKKDN